MIKIITTGKLKEKYLREAIEEYLSRQIWLYRHNWQMGNKTRIL